MLFFETKKYYTHYSLRLKISFQKCIIVVKDKHSLAIISRSFNGYDCLLSRRVLISSRLSNSPMGANPYGPARYDAVLLGMGERVGRTFNGTFQKVV